MNDTSINFKSYIESIIKNLQEKPGADYTVCSKSVRKNNGVARTGIIINREGAEACPIIYVDDFYREGITEKEIEEISDALYADFYEAEREIPVNLADFSEFERAKKKLAFKLVSASQNSELLQKTPHKRFYNLAMVFYYALPEVRPHKSAAILIKQHHIKKWGVSLKKLYEAAFANTPVLFPAVIESMEDIMRGIFEEEPCGQKIPMFVLSNNQKLYGAACMLYPGLIGKFAREKGQDFYILPSSVHEVILVPAKDTNPESLQAIVTDINHTQVAPDEVLADSVYYYSRNRDKILWIS
ncbi:MAG: DUF5688 family protein [Clostridium sp.]|nr:DUF5688 family protein [Clostridium sp.]